MPDLADLFPGFASRTVATEAGPIYARVGGSGPALALLHGFPETSAMWHRVVPDLAARFTTVIIDLRGYGWSSAPRSRNGERYTKRAMAADVVRVMEALGHAAFALAGHDRGARVGYRLALDHPGRLTRLALLDILPTSEVWRRIEAGTGTSPHWRTLAEPEPVPEQTFGRDPEAFFGGLMARWSAAGSLAAFDPRALAHYRAGWTEPSRVHAMCEDYRAGAGSDRGADEADLAVGRTLDVPVYVLASDGYLDKSGAEPALAVWRRTFAPDATGAVIRSGHFLAEENPAAVSAALLAFLG